MNIPVLALLLGFTPPATVEVESLPLDVAALRGRAQVEVRVEEGGKPVVYAGVPLGAVLEGKLKDGARMAALRSLTDAVLLLRAPDGYQVAVSAAAAAMDPRGERYLLALSRDGKPLDAKQGPLKLIVPGEKERVRWIRNVNAIDLVRLPKPTPPVKEAGPGRR